MTLIYRHSFLQSAKIENLSKNRIVNISLNNIYFLKQFTYIFKNQAIKSSLKIKSLKSPPKDKKNNNKRAVKFRKLSPRQLDCAHLLIKGYTIKQMAELLKLSPRTVEAYSNDLKNKLHCRNKAELILTLAEMLNVRKKKILP